MTAIPGIQLLSYTQQAKQGVIHLTNQGVQAVPADAGHIQRIAQVNQFTGPTVDMAQHQAVAGIAKVHYLIRVEQQAPLEHGELVLVIDHDYPLRGRRLQAGGWFKQPERSHAEGFPDTA